MTDSKTPEWVKEEAFTAQTAAIEECVGNRLFVIAEYPFVTGAAKEVLDRHISQALLSAYERGRKEGIEEAARYMSNLARIGARDASKIRDTRMLMLFTDMEHTVVPAIRQLLEVKG